MTHCPGLSLGPGGSTGLARKPLRVTGARLSGKKGGVSAKPRFMGLILIMKEKRKKDACSAMPRDQDCCPITKNVVALDSAN